MSVIYTALPDDRHIRLLDVSLQSGSPVCSFRSVCVYDDVPAEYMAISYCWSDPKEVSKIGLVDGGFLSLSQTLHDLFASLQKESAKFTVWIDALCINQADDIEKASQVLLMGQVYLSAKTVLLWLGASTPDSTSAFRLMQSKKGLPWPFDREEEEDVSDMENFFMVLSRPWFQRVWVIQEITIARHVVVACGDDRADFDTFRKCVFGVWRFLDFDDTHPASVGLLCVTRLLFIRDTYQEEGEVCYETLLELACHCQATDKRDMVFALRGIANNTRPVPLPNYNISENDLYIDTAQALLCHGESLDLLGLCGIENQHYTPHFPTWAPDLRRTSFNEPFVPCGRAGWNAGGSFQKSPVIGTLSEHGQRALKLLVKPVAVVTKCCPPFNSNDVADQQAAVRAILELRPESMPQEEWVHGLVSTLVWGLNIDDLDDLEDYDDYFIEWMQWLASSSSQADLSEIARNPYHLTIKARISGWKAFMTSSGSLGVGPVLVAEGDVICVVPGCRLPVVLRPESAVSNEDMKDLPPRRWWLISWCFAEGLMFGEAEKLDHPFVDIQLY